MQYDIYVQDNYYKTVEAENTHDVLVVIGKDMAAGLINVDENKAHAIRIEPKN